LAKILYNNNIAIDANCIDNFDDLCINFYAYVGDMKNVEAQYYPYAKDYKEHKGEESKKQTESTFNSKKRGSESQEGKPKNDSKIRLPVEGVTMGNVSFVIIRIHILILQQYIMVSKCN